jgi:hypothetical protein
MNSSGVERGHGRLASANLSVVAATTTAPHPQQTWLVSTTAMHNRLPRWVNRVDIAMPLCCPLSPKPDIRSLAAQWLSKSSSVCPTLKNES